MKTAITNLISKLLLCLLIFILLPQNVKCQETTQFKVVFVASTSCNTSWLNTIKQRWGATGVMLDVVWGNVETVPGSFDWNSLDQSISNVLSNGLDVYIRASMGVKKPTWIAPNSAGLTNEDFQVTHNGNIFTYNGSTDPLRIHPLNFGSEKSSAYMLRFYSNLVQHLVSIVQFYSSTYPNCIKEVVPNVSTDEEMEFPYGEMCGYSQPEISKFRKYLLSKYGTIDKLKLRWGAGAEIQDTLSINPRNYDWHNIAPYNYTIYPAGRMDWINWRTLLLKSFIDKCANITQNSGFKIGLQLGSIYDSAIELRGWYDVTPLLENVDALHVADVIEYKPNFTFAADYARSICNYWARIKGKSINFSTETNWPYYGGSSQSRINALNLDWSSQLTTYYEKGANTHFVFGWERSDLNSLESVYSTWRQTLTNYSNLPKNNISYSKAVHLGCEEGNFLGLIPTTTGSSPNFYYTSYLKNSISPQNQYINNANNYDEHCDIVTNFMISNNPTYIQSYYQTFFLTKSSIYISDQTYNNLMRNDITINIGNATWFLNSGHGEFAYSAGLRNEYNDYRSPIHLIWRTRDDLMQLFPTGNYPNPIRAAQIGWDSSQKYDFIFWVSTFGLTEYPGLMIKSTDNLFNYDDNIRKVWNSRSDLQSVFPDAHYYSSTHDWNMIEWATKYGATQYENFIIPASYIYWPYIGTPTNQPAKIGSNEKNNLYISQTQNQQNSFKFYPNVVRQGESIIVQVNSSSKESEFRIIDINGRVISKLILINNQDFKVSTFSLHKGIYILSIEGQEPQKVIVK